MPSPYERLKSNLIQVYTISLFQKIILFDYFKRDQLIPHTKTTILFITSSSLTLLFKRCSA